MDTDLQTIVSGVTASFTSIKSGGMTIVLAAITLGTVFIGAKWLWGKATQWLSKI